MHSTVHSIRPPRHLLLAGVPVPSVVDAVWGFGTRLLLSVLCALIFLRDYPDFGALHPGRVLGSRPSSTFILNPPNYFLLLELLFMDEIVIKKCGPSTRDR